MLGGPHLSHPLLGPQGRGIGQVQTQAADCLGQHRQVAHQDTLHFLYLGTHLWHMHRKGRATQHGTDNTTKQESQTQHMVMQG